MWWLVLVLLFAAGEGLGWLLIAQGMPVAGQAVRWVGAAAQVAWVIYGLLQWQANVWVRRLTAIILVTLAAQVVALRR